MLRMNAMQILAATAIAFGLLLSAFNWGTVVPRRDNRNVSPAPLVGGILLASGFLGFERYTLAENHPDGDDPSIYAIDGIDVDATRLNTDG